MHYLARSKTRNEFNGFFGSSFCGREDPKIKNESLKLAKDVYKIEMECIREMEDYFDEESFSKAVECLKNAPRIGTSGCGHSGIICQHLAHLLCQIRDVAGVDAHAPGTLAHGL